MDFWKAFFTFCGFCLFFLVLFWVGVIVYKVCYRLWRVRQADEVILQTARIVRLERDEHGLGGFIVHLPSGKRINLDEGMSEQLIISALTGASFGAPIAQQLIEEEVPVVQLPSLVSTHNLQAPKDADL